MITFEELDSLARQYHTSVFPNIVREYFQHLFLSLLYQQAGADSLLFKGGTALRIVYGSPRFSEDLDFSLFRVPASQQQVHIESLFADTLTQIERQGPKTELGPKPGPTSGGYYGEARFQIHDFGPVTVEINVQTHPEEEEDIRGEVASVVREFVPAYSLLHLPQELLVTEKLDALFSRKKARDFYDLYFLLRRGLLSPDQKRRIAELQSTIERTAEEADVAAELSAFLPDDQHLLIRDFPETLLREMRRQLAGG